MQLKQLHLNQIGQDSEFFLWDEKKGEVVPSYLYFPTREESVPNPSPTRADLKHKYHKWLFHSNMPTRVFRDGLAVEVNTAPPTCRAFLWDDTRIALAVAEPWKRKPRGLRYTTAPTVYVSEEMRKAFPPDRQVLRRPRPRQGDCHQHDVRPVRGNLPHGNQQPAAGTGDVG